MVPTSPQTLSSRDEELRLLRAEKLRGEKNLRQIYRNTKAFLSKAYSEERIQPETLALLCETDEGGFELTGEVPLEVLKRPLNLSTLPQAPSKDSQNEDSDSLTQLNPPLSQLSNHTASQGRREPFRVIPETPYKPSRKRGRDDDNSLDNAVEAPPQQQKPKNPYLNPSRIPVRVCPPDTTTTTGSSAADLNVRYHEVVRNKDERACMDGYDCPECANFINAVCDPNHFDKAAFMKVCSRHKSRHAPTQTPDNFWEMDFVDEIIEGKEITKKKRKDLPAMKPRGSKNE